ncbi:MAG TPA: hypothetical protein PLN86_04410 [Candidatus Hydrogenedentes bacterium]|nr:hypothetical protein [Candidatus Hydrogenedentota bacterium]
MNSARNPFCFPPANPSVGGRDNAPPATCPRSAYASAYLAACVEVTGSPRTNVCMGVWPGEPSAFFHAGH